MLAINRASALVFLAILGLLAIPMAFAYTAAAVQDVVILGIVLLVMEVGVYFAATLWSNNRISLLVALAASVGMMTVRVLFCIAAVMLAGVFRDDIPMSAQRALANLLSNPVAAILHVAFMMFATIHLVEKFMPGSLGEAMTRKLAGTTEQSAAAPTMAEIRQTVHDAASLKGGFIQVFSYEELAGVIKKSPGLEGFVILSGEGLPVWRELSPRLHGETLTALLAGARERAGEALQAGGLGMGSGMLVETRDHMVYVTSLDANFGLVLVYNTRVSASDCLARTGILSKTTREFLQWKYPALPPMSSAASH
jgi:predicted regulator of Ras-like GTPase activity (Roadblock/LC7/MglB family)